MLAVPAGVTVGDFQACDAFDIRDRLGEIQVPALVIGMGGIWTEVLADVVIVPLPASASRVERALRELRGARLLFGGRGQPPVDVGALSRLAQRTGEVLLEASLALVELNPVLVHPQGEGVTIVDALVVPKAR